MSDPEFNTKANRFDPYRNFKFRIKIGNKYVAGVSHVGGLIRSTQFVPRRSGNDPRSTRLSPGTTNSDPITLERGLTHDLEFEQWANKVWSYGNSNEAGEFVSPEDFRKDITIELYNEANQPVISYTVYRCWVSEFTSMRKLDNSGNAVAIQSITLQHEGWKRDSNVTEPGEPNFS